MTAEVYSKHPPPDPVSSLSITSWSPEGVILTFVVIVVFEVVVLTCVGLRICSRIVKGRRFYFNDYPIFWALFWASGLVAEYLASLLQGGTGHHVAEIVANAPERLTAMAKASTSVAYFSYLD